MTNLQKQ